MQPMIRTLLLILGLTTALSAVEARIDQPSHIFYGNVTLYGQSVDDGTVIQARLVATGQRVGTYSMGRNPRLGGQYALSVAMDDVEPRQDGHARPGDEVQLFIGGQLAAETTVGGIGRAVRLDIDPQLVEGGPNISISDAELYEGSAGEQTGVELTVSLDTTLDEALDIEWTTEDDIATGGTDCSGETDYLSVGHGLVTIAAGSQEQTLTVTVCGDDDIEGDEPFQVKLTGADTGAFRKQTGTINLLDDDNLPEIRIADAWVEEPAARSTEAVFAVTLSRNHDETVTLDWQTEDITATAPADYAANQGTLTLEAGEIAGEIRVQINADDEVEPQEALALRFDNATQATLSRSTVTGIIADPEYDPALHHEHDVRNGEDGIFGIADPTAIAISHNGQNVYVTSESTDQLTAFQRAGGSGALSMIGTVDAEQEGFEDMLMQGPVDVAVSGDDRFVYVAAKASDSIVAFSRNETDGRLTFLENQVHAENPFTGIKEVSRILLSPNGEHLYASGRDSVAVYERDPDTGQLTLIEAEQNGNDDPDDAGGAVNWLDRPLGMAVTPAGDQLLVASRHGDALLVFDRDHDVHSQDFGKLSFVEAIRNNIDGFEGLDGVTDVQISASGEQVYVTAESNHTLSHFARGMDGSLEQHRIWTSGEEALPGMAGAQHLALAPDNVELFVTGFEDSSLTVFQRTMESDDPNAAGDLTVTETFFDEQGRTHYLGGASDIAVTANNLHVYVVANRDNAIVVFTRLSADDLFDDGFN